MSTTSDTTWTLSQYLTVLTQQMYVIRPKLVKFSLRQLAHHLNHHGGWARGMLPNDSHHLLLLCLLVCQVQPTKASQQSLLLLHPIFKEKEAAILAAMQLVEEEELQPAKAAAQQAKQQRKEAEQELAKPGIQAHRSQVSESSSVAASGVKLQSINTSTASA